PTASASRNCGTYSRGRSRRVSWRIRRAGRSIRINMAAAGFMECATIVFLWGWLSLWNTKIRCSIRTKRFRNSRHIRTSGGFSRAGSWCVMELRLFPMADGIRWRADHWRFSELAEFAAAQGHSYCNQEWNVGCRNDLRGARRRRHFVENVERISEEDRSELDQAGALGGSKFSPGISQRAVARRCERWVAIRHRRARARR